MLTNKKKERKREKKNNTNTHQKSIEQINQLRDSTFQLLSPDKTPVKSRGRRNKGITADPRCACWTAGKRT